ncbi:hypothetical protein GQ55_7G185000 [Panicum hallii var. hallii]|uniref:Uncharacterized protein n=1 Tax=Panicum hallii var. hallii TaxID=1504633 RepID=A0A2T7CWF9_9POAL|nr:hypothetical protein GQ55_7G185000 [Panicum hallii var. hallii]
MSKRYFFQALWFSLWFHIQPPSTVKMFLPSLLKMIEFVVFQLFPFKLLTFYTLMNNTIQTSNS